MTKIECHGRHFSTFFHSVGRKKQEKTSCVASYPLCNLSLAGFEPLMSSTGRTRKSKKVHTSPADSKRQAPVAGK